MRGKLFSFAAVLMLLGVGISHARHLGTAPTNPDAWCVYGVSGRSATTGVLTSAEDCIDASGNIIPTTDNSQALGTSALRYSDVESAQVTPTVLVLPITQVGTYAKQGYGITTSTTLPNTSSYEMLLSTNNALLKLASTPTISTISATTGLPIPNGQYLVLGTTATATKILLQDNGVLSGSLLVLTSASTATVTSTQYLNFVFNTGDGFWHQIIGSKSEGF